MTSGSFVSALAVHARKGAGLERSRTGYDIFFRQKGEMAMDRIEDLQAFVAVVEKGSLTAAARQLGRSLQSISRSLAALERGIGVELVRRTTRRSTPTEAGRAFNRRLSVALAEAEAAKREASNRRSEVTGLPRITSSTASAPYTLCRRCARSWRRTPNSILNLRAAIFAEQA